MAEAQIRVDARQLVSEVVWKRAFNRDRGAIGRAESIANEVVYALRCEGLLAGDQPFDASQMMDNLATKFGEPPVRGISHLVAEALVLLNLPAVHRDTLRALLPQPESRAELRAVGLQFRGALRKFHGWKWISRSTDGLVMVLDRDSLSRWFTIAQDATEERADTALNLAAAVARLNESLAADDQDELRRRELLALLRLMQDAPGATTNRRGTVRVVPKSSAL